MSYTPPASDDVDFGVKSYAPPSGGNVILDVTQPDIQPEAIDIQITDLEGSWSGGGWGVGSWGGPDNDRFIGAEVVLVEPNVGTLQLLINDDALISAQRLLTPDPLTIGIAIPLAGIQPFLYSNEWQIDQNRISPSTDIETGPQSLSLSFEVGGGEIDKWRAYDRAGDLTTDSGFGGSFRAIDRSDQGPVEVRSSFDDMRPFEPSLDYFVAGYSESQVAPDRYEINLDLQRPRNRSKAFPEVDQDGWSAGEYGRGAWGVTEAGFVFDLSYGTIGLDDRSVGQIDREGSPTGDDITIPLLLSSEQAGAIADAAGYPGGVTERSVPDGDDQLADDSGRQAVTISTPDGSDLAGGEYLIREWSIEWYSHDKRHRWQATLTITET